MQFDDLAAEQIDRAVRILGGVNRHGGNNFADFVPSFKEIDFNAGELLQFRFDDAAENLGARLVHIVCGAVHPVFGEVGAQVLACIEGELCGCFQEAALVEIGMNRPQDRFRDVSLSLVHFVGGTFLGVLVEWVVIVITVQTIPTRRDRFLHKEGEEVGAETRYRFVLRTNVLSHDL